MPSTFFHCETYAAKGSGGKANMFGVLAEASRTAGFHPHVRDPQPPRRILGLHPTEILALVQERLVVATDRGRRRLPRTFPVLLAAVASIPVRPADVDANPEVTARVDTWIALNVQFFKTEFGAALVAILAHTDEANFHLHVYAVPAPDPVNGAFSMETIWRPLAAQGAARRAGGTRRSQREAFREEAKRLQDRYHAVVGAAADLKRLGADPERRRHPRAVHLAHRRAGEEAARREVAIEEMRAEVERHAANVDAEVERLVAEHRITIVRAAEAEIKSVRAETAERFNRAKRTAHVLIAELVESRNEAARLVDLLMDAGINPNPTRSTS